MLELNQPSHHASFLKTYQRCFFCLFHEWLECMFVRRLVCLLTVVRCKLDPIASESFYCV